MGSNQTMIYIGIGITKNENDETQTSYKKSYDKFIKDTKLPEPKK